MLAPMHPKATTTINRLIQDPSGQVSTFPFPPNIAATIPEEMQKQVYLWMLQKYIWPQVQERKQYERQWDKLLEMARAALKFLGEDPEGSVQSRVQRREQEKKLNDPKTSISKRLEISDTVIFDAIDRLTNLNHFISFKEGLPVQFEIPEDMVFAHENEVYSPMSGLVKSANAWMKWIAQSQDVYRKGWMNTRAHYTYGVSFVDSQFIQKIEMVPRRQPDKSFSQMPELTEVGVTFEPMSIRKLWLNSRLNVYNMNYQPCPFFFEEMPRFVIVANPYHPQTNPFGFANTDKLPKAQWLYGSQEIESWMKAWATQNGNIDPTNLMDPELNVELLWTYYAMLPIGVDQTLEDDPKNPGKFVFDHDESLGIPLSRWIVSTFGNNLANGSQQIVRLQRNFYPRDEIPLFGSAHMPTLDDGAYPMSIGTLLEGHYEQLCKCFIQYIENKDHINDPPCFVQASSPAMNFDLNKKGAKIPVNSMNDVNRQQTYDATQTTPAVLAMIRDQAQTSSKAVEAVLGKAMGSRTSATEASNVFQTAMSGISTDINLHCYDIYGGWATRLWDYTARWVDPDVLAAVTGSYGFAIKPEHMALRLGLKWNTGSAFIESITRQQNIRYLLESSQPGDPSVNRPYLLRALLKEWKFKDVDQIVNDGGVEKQISIANEQAIMTFLGEMVLIDPDQDHMIAIKVKKSYLQDRNSVWNTNPQYVANGPLLVQQIQQHFLFLQMQQLQQQMANQRLMMNDPQSLQPLQNQNGSNPGQLAATAGQANQQSGGMM